MFASETFCNADSPWAPHVHHNMFASAQRLSATLKCARFLEAQLCLWQSYTVPLHRASSAQKPPERRMCSVALFRIKPYFCIDGVSLAFSLLG
eukprot:1148072-Pelagomonas_calceolata.AAC.3